MERNARLFATPWTVVHQAPLSTEFPWQEYWRGLPLPSSEDLPNPGIKHRSPTLQTDSLPSEPPLFTKSKYYFCSKLFSSQQILEIIIAHCFCGTLKNIQRKAMPKNVLTTVQLHSFHMLTRLCSKIFKLGRELPDIQAEFRKSRGTRDQIVKIRWIIEKARDFQKIICFIDSTKPLTV